MNILIGFLLLLFAGTSVAAEGAIPIEQSDGTIRTSKISALPEEAAPETGDWLLGEESGGEIRKIDVGDLPSVNDVDVIWFAGSDESTDLETGTATISLVLPRAFTIDTTVDNGAGCSVVTAPTTSGITVDINEAGTTIMTTNKITIDATETSSEDAGTAPGVTDTALADDALITLDIDAVGSGTAGAGLKCWLIGKWR
jgi:hypothetical protein